MVKKLRGDEEMTYVMVTLLCKTCGKKIGDVYRWAGQHPRAGQEKLQGSCGELVDRPDGGLTLHSSCSCGANPRTAWERIAAQLDALAHDAPTLAGRVGAMRV